MFKKQELGNSWLEINCDCRVLILLQLQLYKFSQIFFFRYLVRNVLHKIKIKTNPESDETTIQINHVLNISKKKNCQKFIRWELGKRM